METVSMYLVIPEKAHERRFVPVGQMWVHTSQSNAEKDAMAHHNENGEPYLVLHNGQVTFTTK